MLKLTTGEKKKSQPLTVGESLKKNHATMVCSMLHVHLHVSLLMDKEKNSNLILSKAFKC